MQLVHQFLSDLLVQYQLAIGPFLMEEVIGTVLFTIVAVCRGTVRTLRGVVDQRQVYMLLDQRVVATETLHKSVGVAVV